MGKLNIYSSVSYNFSFPRVVANFSFLDDFGGMVSNGVNSLGINQPGSPFQTFVSRVPGLSSMFSPVYPQPQYSSQIPVSPPVPSQPGPAPVQGLSPDPSFYKTPKTFIVSKAPGEGMDDHVFWGGQYAGLNKNKPNPQLPLSAMSNNMQAAKGKFMFHDDDSGIDYSDSYLGRYVKLPSLDKDTEGKSTSIEMFIPKDDMGSAKESLDSFLKSSGKTVSSKVYNAAFSPIGPKTWADKAKSFINQIPLGPSNATSWAGRHAYALGLGALGLLGLGLWGLSERNKYKEHNRRWQAFLARQRYGY